MGKMAEVNAVARRKPKKKQHRNAAFEYLRLTQSITKVSMNLVVKLPDLKSSFFISF